MPSEEYDVVEPPAEFTVLTVVPYHPEPEYREYTVPSEDLHLFLSEMADDEHGEQVVTVRAAGNPE